MNKKLWETPDKFNNLAEAIYIQMQKNKEMKVPTKKHLQNDSIFISKLKEYLIQMQKEKHINDPEYINALKNALIRYQISNKKRDKQADLLQKLIENLQKKK